MKTERKKVILKSIRKGIRLKLKAPRAFRDGKQYRRKQKHPVDWR